GAVRAHEGDEDYVLRPMGNNPATLNNSVREVVLFRQVYLHVSHESSQSNLVPPRFMKDLVEIVSGPPQVRPKRPPDSAVPSIISRVVPAIPNVFEVPRIVRECPRFLLELIGNKIQHLKGFGFVFSHLLSFSYASHLGSHFSAKQCPRASSGR